jgi:predicted dehydrogenase
MAIKKKTGETKRQMMASTVIGSGRPLGFMVVGAGIMGNHYFNALKNVPGAELAAVADVSALRLQQVNLEWRPRVVVADYREALDRPDIDIVIVCTPNRSHRDVTVNSLRAGKHVFCEKPLAMTVAEADEMIATAEACDRQLYVMLGMRFDKRHNMVRRLVFENAIGKPFLTRAYYLGYEMARMNDPASWKGDMVQAGGGVLLDGGYHVVDLLNDLFGRARAVQAIGRRQVIQPTNKGEDNIAVLIEYECGVIADLTVSFTAFNVGCRENPTLMLGMDVFGTDGTIQSDYDSSTLVQRLDVITTHGREKVDLTKVAVAQQVQHFIDCLTRGTKPVVTALDGRNATAVVAAAYESMRTGRKVPVEWKE